MFETALGFGANFAIIAALIAVHETGHYLAGRVAEIPADRLSIELLETPPHVALVDDDGTAVSPQEWPRFGELQDRYLDAGREEYLFLAGGHGLELAAALAVAVLGVATGSAVVLELAGRAAWFALLISGLYLAVDVVASLRHGVPYGDFSAQWRLAPPVTAGFVVAYFGALAALLAALQNGV